MNRFAVIGLGSFGRSVVQRLFEEDEEVIAVDIDEDAVQACTDISHHSVVADATDKKTLSELMIGDVDIAVVSLGERMDIITLVALHLKELGVPYIAVKAISDDHVKILKAIGINEVIQPEKEAALRLGRRLALHNVDDVLQLFRGYSVVSMHANDKIAGRKIADLESKKIQVVAIQHADDRIPTLVPSDQEIIDVSDLLILIGSNSEISVFTKLYCKG
jgi:trk system potassium uptake protein TrkA